MENFLNKFIHWAERQDPIRAVILQGSRAAGRADAYSDYDLALFCSKYDPYIQDEKWLSSLGNVWVCVHEKISQAEREFPTRLIIFEGGIKVDLSFYTLDMLKCTEAAQGTVLLDKDHLAASIAKMTNTSGKKPSEQEFQQVVQEFWFEAYHVAVYLKRQDLWSVKFRSNALHAFLLHMIEWRTQAENNWRKTPPPHGKRMASWADANTWKALHAVFAHFDTADSWNALFHTLTLFKRLSVDLSHRLEFAYPETLDKNISEFILKLQESLFPILPE